MNLTSNLWMKLKGHKKNHDFCLKISIFWASSQNRFPCGNFQSQICFQLLKNSIVLIFTRVWLYFKNETGLYWNRFIYVSVLGAISSALLSFVLIFWMKPDKFYKRNQFISRTGLFALIFLIMFACSTSNIFKFNLKYNRLNFGNETGLCCS